MSWGKAGTPYVASANGAIGPAAGNAVVESVTLTGGFGGSALAEMTAAGGTVFGAIRAGMGQSITIAPNAAYRAPGTIAVSGGTVSLTISRVGAGTAV